MKKFQGKSSTVIWCIASVCAVLSLVYYLSTGNSIVISIVSAFVVLFLSMIVVSVVVGVVMGVMELFSPSKKQAEQENSSPNEPITETFDVAGTHYCMQNISGSWVRVPDGAPKKPRHCVRFNACRGLFFYSDSVLTSF